MRKQILIFLQQNISKVSKHIVISFNDEMNDILVSVKKHLSNLQNILFYAWLVVKKVLFGFIADTKLIMETRHKAGKNNYVLGVKMLKENFLPDAKVRFLLSDMFYNKSAMTKYYIAYIYYLEGNYNKSLRYLKESVNLRPSMKISSELLEKIENDMKVVNK
ncbi:MAG: hypothetical protein RL208_689 [Pseudomonadota bacterium]|jgi:tetratricopeptide (TPR) repeat protein